MFNIPVKYIAGHNLSWTMRVTTHCIFSQAALSSCDMLMKMHVFIHVCLLPLWECVYNQKDVIA